MGGLGRRTFLTTIASAFCVFGGRTTFASLHSDVDGRSTAQRIALANAFNLRAFLQDKDSYALAGLMSMRAVEVDAVSHPEGALLLFPFKRNATVADVPVLLPGPNATKPLIATVPMPAIGLPPDEYFCHYVLQAPRASFIGFTVDIPVPRGQDRWPWHTNVALDGDVISVRWTSSNLNHPWFAGSRWIPDSGDGKVRRERIIDALRQVSETPW